MYCYSFLSNIKSTTTIINTFVSRNLWKFVSHFTQQDTQQLYETYRQALKDTEFVLKPSPEVEKDEDLERKPVIDVTIYISIYFFLVFRCIAISLKN